MSGGLAWGPMFLMCFPCRPSSWHLNTCPTPGTPVLEPCIIDVLPCTITSSLVRRRDLLQPTAKYYMTFLSTRFGRHSFFYIANKISKSCKCFPFSRQPVHLLIFFFCTPMEQKGIYFYLYILLLFISS